MERTDAGFRPVATKIIYGSGEIDGFVVQDHVRLSSVLLPNQSFIIVQDAVLPPNRSWDGICGFGWMHLAAAGVPLYKNLQESSDSTVFTFVPRNDQSESYMAVGSHEVDIACRPDTLVWVPAEKLSHGDPGFSFWIISVVLDINKKKPEKVRFLVDTGTTFLLTPPQVFQ